MKKETISEALGEIDERYVEEAVTHQPKKKSRLALRVGAMAAGFLIAAGLITTATFAVRDVGKGEILPGDMWDHIQLTWIESTGTVALPAIVTGNYTDYHYAQCILDEIYADELLETVQVEGQDKEAKIYAIRGVDPEIAVYALLDSGNNYLCYNPIAQIPTLSDLWNMTGIVENMERNSSLDVYEYRTKNTTYHREYQAENLQMDAFLELLRSTNGTLVEGNIDGLAACKRAVYFHYSFENSLEYGRIIVEDNGLLTIAASEIRWVKTFHIGVENAVRLIDAIESLPRKEEKEFSTSYEKTVTETTHVAETRGE